MNQKGYSSSSEMMSQADRPLVQNAAEGANPLGPAAAPVNGGGSNNNSMAQNEGGDDEEAWNHY